jgi:protease-4
MKQFFKFFFASCLGFIVGSIVLSLIGVMIFAGIASTAEQKPQVSSNSVLHLSFDNIIPEYTNNLEAAGFDIYDEKTLGLHEIIGTINNAAEDNRIKGIFMEVDALMTGGTASAAELRKALLDFQNEGKFILAYSKYYTQGAYYVASVADELYVHPLGIIDFRGFSAQIPFYKNMLDKVGVKMQVFYAGQFKSATEPYRRTDMSPQNRFQVRQYLNGMYDNFLEDISQSRSIDVPELKRIANDFLASDPQKAVELKMVDVAGYRDEALASLRDRLGLEKDEKIRFISLKNYNKANPPSLGSYSSDRIAVVYAEGGIVDGEGSNGSIGDKRYNKVFNDIRKDDRIKAVVLRVNSPGGSALSAENMHHEISRLKATGKPIVVSMGDYAASAGYYISCLADSIVARPSTLTGSIGVFSILPNAQNLLNEKIGINFDTVRTGDFSAGLTPFYDLTDKETRWFQKRTEDMYETFLGKVAEGRNMTRDEVHKIAQGRVWTGEEALEVGLVDQLGDLDKAIEIAANMADMDDYRIKEYPFIKSAWLELLEELSGEKDNDFKFQALLKAQWPDYYPYYKELKAIQEAEGPQMRLPFFIPFE